VSYLFLGEGEFSFAGVRCCLLIVWVVDDFRYFDLDVFMCVGLNCVLFFILLL